MSLFWRTTFEPAEVPRDLLIAKPAGFSSFELRTIFAKAVIKLVHSSWNCASTPLELLKFPPLELLVPINSRPAEVIRSLST